MRDNHSTCVELSSMDLEDISAGLHKSKKKPTGVASAATGNHVLPTLPSGSNVQSGQSLMGSVASPVKNAISAVASAATGGCANGVCSKH